MTQSPVRPKPRGAATPGAASDSDSQTGPGTRDGRGRMRRPVPASRIVRSAPLPPHDRATDRGIFLGWGAGLSRAERERAKERLAIAALSSVLVVAVLLFGGTLLWDQVIRGYQAVLRVDGKTTSLRQYAQLRAYKETELLAELQQMQNFASQPASSDPNDSTAFLRQYAQQQMSQIQNQLSGLSEQLVDDLADAQIIRGEATKRGITVTRDEVDKELKSLVGYQDPNATPVPSPTPSTDQVAAQATADAAAQAQGTPAPTVAPTAVAPTVAPAATVAGKKAPTFQSTLRDYLRATGASEAIVRTDVENKLLRQKLNDDVAKTVATTAEQVHVQHILVPDETAANVVLQRLQNGESFEAVAADVSIDTSNKDKGGDLGWFTHGVMVSEFEDAAFKLQPGETSGPVKTQFGVHIIRMIERDPNRPLDSNQLQTAKSSALQKWLDDEKKNHKIERLLDSGKIDWAYRHAPKPRTLQ